MFALPIEQLPEAGATTLWNLAYDAGYGAAPAIFGLFAARTGYPAAFALTGTMVLAALPAALASGRPCQHRALGVITAALVPRRRQRPYRS